MAWCLFVNHISFYSLIKLEFQSSLTKASIKWTIWNCFFFVWGIMIKFQISTISYGQPKQLLIQMWLPIHNLDHTRIKRTWNMSAHTSSWNVHATHTKFSHVNDLIFAYFLAFKLLTLSVFTAKFDHKLERHYHQEGPQNPVHP